MKNRYILFFLTVVPHTALAMDTATRALEKIIISTPLTPAERSALAQEEENISTLFNQLPKTLDAILIDSKTFNHIMDQTRSALNDYLQHPALSLELSKLDKDRAFRRLCAAYSLSILQFQQAVANKYLLSPEKRTALLIRIKNEQIEKQARDARQRSIDKIVAAIAASSILVGFLDYEAKL